ncbi:PLC-like phosphodiesterase [Mycena indigotica]|uniref:PLC-like phosphodiesterase n=1 Tax=Mycena indigotica TaxID=2126181 RepID=A0A8H6W0B6_9AGAR|nr:PLC-like phosphodiesterase [Mycena indigotica]KAF7294729.1 PLC-like phosphodiesterase [Mycena indigotica]
MLPESTPPTGSCLPPHTPHTLCNSLPRWEDNVDLVTSRIEAVKLRTKAESTYHRFSIHPHVEKLSTIVLNALGASKNQRCFLFPTARLAHEFRIHLETNVSGASCLVQNVTDIANVPVNHSLFAALFTTELKDAMKFYIFAGCGISPRLAEICVQRAEGNFSQPLSLPQSNGDHCFGDYYVKHAPLSSPEAAKQALRTRFSGTFGGVNVRGVAGVTAEDVYLYSSGMHAIWQSYKLLQNVFGSSEKDVKVAHVNLLYCDIYKYVDLPGAPGHHFFTNETLDELETLLSTGTRTQPAVLAIYTDFPGNPHLLSTDIIRLHALSNRYGVPLIVDESVGGFLNVQLLPYCDVVVSSLTKLFSGLANVLGGAMLLNPSSLFYSRFKRTLEITYEDALFDHDALVLEMNSREYVQRIAVTNRNAEMLSDMLYPLSRHGGARESVLEAVHYPKYRARKNFDQVRNPLAGDAGLEETGYGFLLSVTFTSLEAAKAFYTSLQCYRTPTFGAIFTLATAWSAIAFPPDKMEWLEQHGVEEYLVRISVGMEDTEAILKCVRDALDVAQKNSAEACDC